VNAKVSTGAKASGDAKVIAAVKTSNDVKTSSDVKNLARLVVVLGPTASGKSALGIALAERLNGEILVCDSTQLYRHFDIGTAKVPKPEQKNIPHHLVDLVEPGEVFTAGDYRRHALLALEDLRARGKTPIITAGTGLYLRALLEGLDDAPQRSEELRTRLRAIVEARGAAHLHKILARLDPGAAARIAPRDTQKIIRAIEMRVLAGKPLAEIFSAGRAELRGEVRDEERDELRAEARGEALGEVRKEVRAEARGEVREKARGEARVNDRAEVHEKVRVAVRDGVRENSLKGYAITKIGLLPPRAALYARIDARANEMLAAGWLDEVRALIARGIPSGVLGGVLENVKPFQFIGYADLRAHLEGRITLAAAVAQIQQSTRRFAKRQLTWFRREPDVHWLEAFGDAPETTAAALNLLAAKS
jgi:tRNA A37 N6-isopentenylltransferase MiaA